MAVSAARHRRKGNKTANGCARKRGSHEEECTHEMDTIGNWAGRRAVNGGVPGRNARNLGRSLHRVVAHPAGADVWQPCRPELVESLWRAGECDGFVADRRFAV